MNDNNFFISESSDNDDDIEIQRNRSLIVPRNYQAYGDFSIDMFDSKRKQYPKSFVVPRDDFDERIADEIQTINDYNKSVILAKSVIMKDVKSQKESI